MKLCFPSTTKMARYSSMNICPHFVFLLLAWLLLPPFNCCAAAGGTNSSTRCIKQEREALIKLNCWPYQHQHHECCDWDGVKCHYSTGHVIGLEIPRNCSQDKVSPSLAELKHLESLDLSGLELQGPIPEEIANLKQLRELNLDNNNFQGSGLIPKDLGQNLCSLRTLYLNYSNLTDELPSIIQSLIGCAHKSLVTLGLRHNQLWGSIPDMMGAFSSLEELYLEDNQLNGTISQSLGQLSRLQSLCLHSNSLRGTLSHHHLSNLSRLTELSLSGNLALVVNISADWAPPFQLRSIEMSSCNLGPQFPKWLYTQKSISFLDISNAGISDAILPSFWKSSLQNVMYLNMSHNKIHGMLPNLSMTFRWSPFEVDLSSNQIEGLIPAFLRDSMALFLNDNRFSNSNPFFCPKTSNFILSYLDLSNNLLSGELPNCWMHFDRLNYLLLDNNNFSGSLPASIGELTVLTSLKLRNNSISGELPVSLKNCQCLNILDLSHNSLSGYIPSWIGYLTGLEILSLNHNKFHRDLPSSLCELSKLLIVDLSFNHISGKIPKCIHNLTAMIQSVGNPDNVFFPLDHMDTVEWIMWKRVERSFVYDSKLVKAIDISSNELEGEIPEEISSLNGLVFVNLSRNNLSGSITWKIGQLTQLESLDLSNNRLEGEIPASLSSLSYLGVLDLSNNNLSGRIPLGTQLQGFNASCYMGNPNLCGDPLLKCPGDQAPNNDTLKENGEDENGNDYIFPGLYISVALGFIVGFWGVCGTLVIKRSWRHAYFRFLGDLKDRFYVIFLISVAKMRRKHETQRTSCVLAAGS